MGQYDRKRVRLSPTGDSLTQQHFTFHDGEKKDYSSQSSCFIKKVCPGRDIPYINCLGKQRLSYLQSFEHPCKQQS